MSLINHIQQTIGRFQTNVGYVRLGIISSVSAVDSMVKVVIEPEAIETGFIPFATSWIGWYAPPTTGDQCVVLFQEGDKNVPIAALLLYLLNGRLPPADVASGEAILYHSTGSFIKLANSGNITINSDADVDITAAGNLTATVQGNATVTTSGNANVTAASGEITLQAPTINLIGNAIITGTLSADNGSITASAGDFSTTGSITATGNVTGAGISLDSHVHSGVTTGGSNTGGPV